jgi:hypothetical protein
MPTSNPRINVVLDPKVWDLLKEAMEIHEDEYWAGVAGERLRSFDRKKALTPGRLKAKLSKRG